MQRQNQICSSGALCFDVKEEEGGREEEGAVMAMVYVLFFTYKKERCPREIIRERRTAGMKRNCRGV